MSTYISRSTFIKALAAAGVAAAGKLYFDSKEDIQKIPCKMLGPSRELGHMVRDAAFKESDSAEGVRKKVLIVGGGIAGLSAAWSFQKAGFSDFALLEMEKSVGGNSSSGKNRISSYPWGAHYVPLANEESAYVRELFEELGVITGYKAGLPEYNELYLCHAPQERLYKDGVFQEGLVPKRGLQEFEDKQLGKFFQLVEQLRRSKGKDGKPAFAIPLDLSSGDEEFRSLDKISMADWLKKNGLDSAPLRWYVNYCCRDDYGASSDSVSAWAGLHYFAGRRGRACNSEHNSLVTWPEGNGYLVDRLKEKIRDRITTAAVVSKIKEQGEKIQVTYIDSESKKPYLCQCEYLIVCAPRFVAKHLFQVKGADLPSFVLPEYSPWMVANLSLRRLPAGRGEDIAWDNVSYYSESLGYVVATHQDITTREAESVITYYLPLTRSTPSVERKRLLKTEQAEWVKFITADLEKMHPGISSQITSIELWPWGHGMVRPSVGYIWGDDRRKMQNKGGRIYFAHSDMSGISNFEEAQYQGVEAAKKILAELRVT